MVTTRQKRKSNVRNFLADQSNTINRDSVQSLYDQGSFKRANAVAKQSTAQASAPTELAPEPTKSFNGGVSFLPGTSAQDKKQAYNNLNDSRSNGSNQPITQAQNDVNPFSGLLGQFQAAGALGANFLQGQGLDLGELQTNTELGRQRSNEFIGSAKDARSQALDFLNLARNPLSDSSFQPFADKIEQFRTREIDDTSALFGPESDRVLQFKQDVGNDDVNRFLTGFSSAKSAAAGEAALQRGLIAEEAQARRDVNQTAANRELAGLESLRNVNLTGASNLENRAISDLQASQGFLGLSNQAAGSKGQLDLGQRQLGGDLLDSSFANQLKAVQSDIAARQQQFENDIKIADLINSFRQQMQEGKITKKQFALIEEQLQLQRDQLSAASDGGFLEF